MPAISRYRAWTALAAVGVGLASWPARASITADRPLTGNPTADYPGVGQLGDSGGFDASATAILGGGYVLTARHAVTTDATISGPLKAAFNLRFKLDGITYSGVEVFADFGADLAVVRLDGAASYSYGMWDGTKGTELGQTFLAVGFGDTDSDGNGRWGPGGRGSKRLFANRIDDIRAGGLAGQGTILRYDFDKNGGDWVGGLEGIAGPADSGGGVFLPWGGSYLLAGVLSSSGDPVNGAGGSAVRVAEYAQAIEAVVPEPSALSVLFVVVSAFLVRRHP